MRGWGEEVGWEALLALLCTGRRSRRSVRFGIEFYPTLSLAVHQGLN